MKKIVIRSIPGRPEHRLPRRRRIRGKYIFAFVLALLIAVVSYNMIHTPNHKPQVAPSLPEPAPEPAASNSLDYPDSSMLRSQYFERFSIKHHIVREGDTLSQILDALGLSGTLAGQWEKSCRSFPKLNQLKPEDELIIHVSRSDNQPVKIIYSSAQGSTYTLRRVGSDWDCRDDRVLPLSLGTTIRGTFAEDLYDSCIAAGLPAGLVADLTDVFAYDVDFNSDLKEGDGFTVYYEEQVKNGRKSKEGTILGAELTVSKQVYQAFLYKFPDGSTEYFDAKGTSLRKPFLKSPLSYRRIMAASNYKPLKPILKIYRPHMGIDYAAPKGTPVSTVGDGTVSAMGKNQKEGRFMEIRHKGGFQTFYGHLSGYSKGLKNGSKVTEGQIIGMVGSADSSTTPYLDFRIFRYGKPVNYLKSDFPRSRTIPKALKPDFEKKRDTCLAALQGNPHGPFKSAAGSPVHE